MSAIRIKRRLTGGAAGAPSTLENAEIAFNENDNILYYGGGTGGAGGSADNIFPIAGNGAFADLTSNQTIGGVKTFSNPVTVAAPVADTDAATKLYVDTVAQGLSPKPSVKAATTANISLTGEQTIDGVALVTGDRVLVKDQTTPSENGIYLVDSGAWARTVDADAWSDLVSAFVFVEEGTANADVGFLSTVDQGGTIDSTAVVFTQFSTVGETTAGAGLTKTGNEISLTGQALAVHQLGTNGIFARTAADTIAARTISTTGNGVSVADGDGVSGNPTISLDATLDAFSQITFAADSMVYATAADTFATSTISAFARTLIDDADASTARTTLGLGSIATQDSNSVSITGGTIDGVTIDGGSY